MSYIIYLVYAHIITLTQNALTKLCQNGLNMYSLFILDPRNIPSSLKRFKISSSSKYNVANNQKVIYIWKFFLSKLLVASS